MTRLAPIASVLAALLVAGPAIADFESDAERVRKALATNPKRVLPANLDSCLNRFRFAIELYDAGQETRAERRLRSCIKLLGLPEEKPEHRRRVQAATRRELDDRARLELERALSLEPDIDNGLEVYRECAACHTPEGWGLASGTVPQIAGQHGSVIIKQLADIRAGNRSTVLMAPYADVKSIGDAQSIADVAAYVSTLEMNATNDKGPGTDLVLGEQLYRENCVQCHGAAGEGDAEARVPRLQAQHYAYVVRQLDWIQSGQRRNGNPEMVKQIQSFDDEQKQAVADYVSRLAPPAELQAPEDWKNPDFEQ